MAFKNPLSLDQMDGMILNGQLPDVIYKNLIVGDPDATHLELIGDQFSVIRPDPDGTLIPTVELGGSSHDRLQLIDPATGEIYAGFDDVGNGSVQGDWNVGGQLLVNGQSIADSVNALPRGIIGGFKITSDTSPTSTTEVGIAEVSADVEPGRQYVLRIRANTFGPAQTVSTARVYNTIRYTLDGSAPTISSPQMDALYQAIPLHSYPWYYMPLDFPFTVGIPGTIRMLWTMYSPIIDAGRYVYARSFAPAFIWIEDIGPALDEGMTTGQMNTGGGSSAPAKVTKTATFKCTWSRTWRNNAVYLSNGNVMQGTYGGNVHRSMMGFNLSALVGSSISSMKFSAYTVHAYYNAGLTLVTNPMPYASAPASFGASGTAYTTSGWPKPGWKTITLPSSWYAGFANGTYNGLSFGNGVGSDLSYYGYLDGRIGVSTTAYLTVTYTK